MPLIPTRPHNARPHGASLSTGFINRSVCVLALLALLLAGFACSSPEAKLEKEPERLTRTLNEEREATLKELLERNTPSETDSEAMWAGFRKAYPFHTQVIALSGTSADGSRTLVVSEPPPHVKTEDILFPFSALLLNHAVRQHPVGYDGWVKDVVLEIAGGDEYEVDAALGALNRALFHTSYMSYVIPLPAYAPEKSDLNLDLQVTSVELKSWVIDSRASFTPVEGGDELSLQDVFGQATSGVFYSGSGLVGWWIPKGRTLDDCRIQSRQFSLDSDLIVGAVADARGILVVGRERIVPVDVLPPLRFETLQVLAAVQQGQGGGLKQSYERNHQFAGRIDEGWDWAPILLSPELRDTEYGSLLNITDQLLKGWSNAGETFYFNFDYPRPSRFPFGGPLLARLDANRLTYNWNTRGAGYTVGVGDYELMALNRTGALPVSYFPEGSAEPDAAAVAKVTKAEDEAYNYFASLNDPNLVRVVQYAALYQIFSAFDVARPSSPVPSTSFPDQKLEEMTGELLSEIRGASDGQLSELAEQLTPLVSAEINDRSSIQTFLDDYMARTQRRAEADLQANGWKKGSPEYETKLRDHLSEARARAEASIDEQLTKGDRELRSQVEAQLLSVKAGQEPQYVRDQHVRVVALSQLAHARNMPNRYAEAVKSTAEGWIHTPAVVLSWNGGSMRGGIGGHNLDARVTRFRLSEDVPPGKVEFDYDYILINPRDAGKVNRLVRTAGRAENDVNRPAILDNAFKKSPSSPPRPPTTALALPGSGSSPPKGPRRPPLSAASVGPDPEHWHAGWSKPRGQTGPDPLAEQLAEIRSEIPEAIRVDRDSENVIRIAHNERADSIIASNVEDIVDFVVLRNRIPKNAEADAEVIFTGFSKSEVDAFKKSLEARAESENFPNEVSSLIGREEPTPADFYSGGRRGPNEPGPGGRGGGDAYEPFPLFWRNPRQFDYAKAEVRTLSDITSRPDGTQVSQIVIDIPRVETGAPASQTALDLGFHRTTPREVIPVATEKVAGRVRNFVRSIRDELHAMRFNFKVNREVKKVSKEMKIKMKVLQHRYTEDRNDTFFSRRREESDEPPDAAGCQSA